MIDKKEKNYGNGYFLAFGYHWLRSELQKGQSPWVCSSWLPQLGQKTPASSVVGVAVFGFLSMAGWAALGCFECFFLRVTASNAAMTMITTRSMAAKNIGEDRKLVLPFDRV